MKANALRDMTSDELLQKLNELREAQFNLKFQHATGTAGEHRPDAQEQKRYSAYS